MIKISDTKVNQQVTLTLVVTAAVARETKAKKPYLQLELFDGIDKIQGNYWDWTSGKIPEVNTIVDVSGQVTEYLGAKQLNVKSMAINTTLHLSAFAPTSGVDLGEVYKEAIAIASDIKDDFLRDLSLSSLEALLVQWCEAPGAKGVHHAFVGGTLVHSVAVAKAALALSKLYHASNDDLCVAGGLLHDIGKLYTYKIDGVTVAMTDIGQLYDHTFIGAEFIGNFAATLSGHNEDEYEDKLMLLRHIILSHHGVLEYGAAVPPMCIEAHIVSAADGVDAEVQQVIEASRKLKDVMWTDRIYALNNRPQLTPQYISSIITQD